MAKHEKSAGAVIYYLDKDQKPIFLLLQNTLKTTYWEFPKGKIEKNENIEETVRREVFEETGLRNIHIISDFKHILSWYFQFEGQTIRKEAVYLLAKISPSEKNNVKISKEHQKFQFMSLDDAKKEIKLKSNLEMLKKANDFILKNDKQKSLF